MRETGTVRLDRADLITTPVLLGTPDVLRVISTLPGVSSGMAEASLYYTLSKTERYFPELYPDWFPDRFDNRHKITLTGSIKLTDKIVLNAMWNYHSGNRISIPTHYSVDEDGRTSLMSPVPAICQLSC